MQRVGSSKQHPASEIWQTAKQGNPRDMVNQKGCRGRRRHVTIQCGGRPEARD